MKMLQQLLDILQVLVELGGKIKIMRKQITNAIHKSAPLVSSAGVSEGGKSYAVLARYSTFDPACMYVSRAQSEEDKGKQPARPWRQQQQQQHNKILLTSEAFLELGPLYLSTIAGWFLAFLSSPLNKCVSQPPIIIVCFLIKRRKGNDFLSNLKVSTSERLSNTLRFALFK